MSSKSIIYYIKSGLIGTLIGSFYIYIFILILDTIFENIPYNFIPLLSFIPLIIILNDYNTYEKMIVGYTGYIVGHIIGLSILMRTGIISIFWGWIYIIVSLVIILYKVGFLNFIWELIKGVKNARY